MTADAAALFEQGNASYDQGRLDEAIASYRAAVRIKPAFPQAHNNLGAALRSAGRLDEAIAACREAVRLDPKYASAWSNLGGALQRRGRLDEAVAAYETSIRLKPDHATAHYNLGCALRVLNRIRDATEALRSAVALKPNFPDAQSNLGAVLREQERLPEALTAYEHALRTRPDWGAAAAHVIHLRREMAIWDGLESREHALRAAAAGGSPQSFGIPPFSMLAAETTAEEQLVIARHWAAHAKLVPVGRIPHRRMSQTETGPIRIGYLSSDFHEHATAYLIAGMLEAHDRDAFEIVAYSYGRSDASAMRARLQAACSRFVDVAPLTDEEIAARIDADGIDILVDLKGLTQHARTGILAYRAAPIQIQFVGYPGTMGTPLIDYLIADSFIVPERHFRFYDERIVHMPDCYQPNDPLRPIAPPPSRRDVGLPDDGLVLCSFNETYKITPPVFDVWMRVLSAVPRSVLWLMASNPWAPDNLRREAAARGVDPARLVFAPRVPNAAHLGRLTLADLFLDTFPVNAHTTASDALWAGVPLVTRAGETFASRVAGSLLNALGLSALVTTTLDEYAAKAMELATQPDRLHALRATMPERRRSSTLFDAARFASCLESAYREMWARSRRGDPPSSLVVAR